MADTATNTAAQSTGGGGVSADPISAAIEAAATIANTIAGINDMNKRRQFEQALSLLDNRQRNELNEKMLKAQTDSDRLQILSTTLVQFVIANETSGAKQDTVLYVVAGSLAAVILIGAIIYSVKK